MNAFQICHNTSDLIPFYLPQQLYLKPIARINISLRLPNVKKLGKSISHWEIMDKIRELIRPDEFTVLKVTKTTVEFIRFEAELETRDKLEKILSKVNNKMIKLKDFSELMRLKAAEWKSDFPNRHIWDDFFQNARDMDEMKPGQRPDTIHISNVPSKWFIPYHLSDEDEIIPSEKIFYRAFEKFGSIRCVDIPICDPYRNKMKDHISGLKTSTFTNKEFFEGYVQFKDYIGFTRAMDSLRNMKLVHKEDDTVLEVNINVDFDKSKHLSEASMKRRSIVRERLVKKAAEQYEKDKLELEEKKRKESVEKQKELDIKEQKKMRRKIREEKRKAKMLEKLEINGAEINDKIAKEEKKLLRVQRKLEAIRLIEELFRRIQDKNPHDIQCYDDPQSQNELRNFKNTSELEVLQQRENLHNALKGRVMLKSVLSGSITKRDRRHSSSSSNSDLSLDTPIHPTGQPPNSIVYNKYPELMYEHNWLGVPYFMPTPIPDPYHHLRGFLPGRGFPRLPSIIPGPSRGGGYGRRRGGYRYRGGARGGGGNFNQYPTDREYNNHDDRSRSRGSYSPPRRRRSRSRSRRSYSRSYSRSRSRSRTRRRRTRSNSYRSRSRQSYSRSRSREKRSKSRSKSRSSRRKKSESNNSTRDKSKDRKYKSRSREKSVDSCAFMTPAQLHEKRARSKSWSMPKDSEKDRSWSKSPSRKKE